MMDLVALNESILLSAMLLNQYEHQAHEYAIATGRSQRESIQLEMAQTQREIEMLATERSATFRQICTIDLFEQYESLRNPTLYFLRRHGLLRDEFKAEIERRLRVVEGCINVAEKGV
jgi:hypothetical protein